MKSFIALANILLAVFCCTAGAVVQKGDKPALEFKAVDGQQISLAALHGKLVVIDFWATWCGPCMAEAGHMVQVNQQYTDKGLIMLGISLDSDSAEMKKVAQEKGFIWPQYFDGLGWKNKFAVEWGVHGIPCTFLIGPEGNVLWTGHPAGGLDQAIADAMKNNPPLLIDPAIAAQAATVLDQVEADMKNKDMTAAIKAMAKIPADAAKEPKFAARLTADQKAVGEAADAMLAQVDTLIGQKQYTDAAGKLKELTDGLNGTPAGNKAKEKLSALLSDPAVKAQIEAARKLEQAAAALAVAQKLKADKKDALAYPRFKEVVTQFSNTPEATAAAQEVANYEKDPAFIKKITTEAVAGKAKAALNLAGSYLASGRKDLAQKKYQDVINQFPGTEWAQLAQKQLDEMGQ